MDIIIGSREDFSRGLLLRGRGGREVWIAVWGVGVRVDEGGDVVWWGGRVESRVEGGPGLLALLVP